MSVRRTAAVLAVMAPLAFTAPAGAADTLAPPDRGVGAGLVPDDCAGQPLRVLDGRFVRGDCLTGAGVPAPTDVPTAG